MSESASTAGWMLGWAEHPPATQVPVTTGLAQATMWMAVFTDMGARLVFGNGLRLLRK